MMFDEPGDEEDFRKMIAECSVAHANIDEGVRRLLTDNDCHHFTPFGNFFVGRNIIISEIIDEYGHMHLLSFGSRDFNPWEIRGMLAYVANSVIQGEGGL